MAALADAAFGMPALTQAWKQILAGDAEDGELGRSVGRFADDVDSRLSSLSQELASGDYRPHDLSEVEIAESDRQRVLHIPSVRDRVVARALLGVATPLVDPVLGPAAYAYRPGLGVADAVQAVAALREEGLTWVLRTDIDECFPTIPVGLARSMFAALVDDPQITTVVDLLLGRAVQRPRRGRGVMRGLPQGCPLSPLMTNLVLERVDSALLDDGFAVVRYADDITVATGSREDAWEALRCVSTAVRRLGMELGEEDTAVMSFEEGFAFLGEDFGPRYPPSVTDARVEDPDRKVLYVGLQGGRVRVGGGRVIVESKDDIEHLDVAKTHVERVVTFGSVGVSAGARSWALSSGVDIVCASRRGSYLGSFVGGAGTQRPGRVRAQITLRETPRALGLSRSLVEAKLRKQLALLRRYGRRHHVEMVQDGVHAIEQVLRLLPDAETPAELMGVEGAAAAAYFPALGALLPDALSFTQRSRQPPLDVANSALSFLYTLLLGESVTAVYAAGLDPAFGVLHSDHDHRPSLALDLMEEFRPWVVDQVVVNAARRRVLQPGHAKRDEGRAGVLLSKAGRQGLITAYEQRMQTRARGALPGFSGTLRRHLYRQAQRLATAIVDPATEFTGAAWR